MPFQRKSREDRKHEPRLSFGTCDADIDRLEQYLRCVVKDKNVWLSETINALPLVKLVICEEPPIVAHPNDNTPEKQATSVAASISRAREGEEKLYEGFSAAYWSKQKEALWPESYRRSLT